MNFLEARRIVEAFEGGPELAFLFGLSGTPDPFKLYLEAAGASRGVSARPRFLPFNTLPQHLASTRPEGAEAYLLLPWDLVPELDWRSGVPADRVALAEALAGARQLLARLRDRSASVAYLPAPIPPVVGAEAGNRALEQGLTALALEAAILLPADSFSLASYLGSGCPVGGNALGKVADLMVAALMATPRVPAKVLVTDLDNTLWSGVVAEDGPDGIKYGPEGAGFRHYVYQTLLGRIRREGALLAAVTRNDDQVVLPPFRSGQMALGEADFVAICASYHAKSAQIRQLATQLNLGLDSFVFVDDNPIERAEVEASLPEVRVLPFPTRDDELPALLATVATLFERSELTVEDRERTAMYRRRLEGMAPVEAEGADLTRFLAGLEMRLVLHDRTAGDRTRAVQLINKTNQFNANGRRWTDEEVGAVIARGGRLFGASLSDRTGSHGEILSCLVGPDGVIEAFVMSCRVFQRRVEFAFLSALAERGIRPTQVRYAETDRNEPFRQFIRDSAFGTSADELLSFDPLAFAERHADAVALCGVSWT